MYGLAKIAASFDAQRNKQYWQMLKRMYGGSDEAVAAIRQSGDDGIWHGTGGSIDEILNDGLKKGYGADVRGSGVYFGPKDIAEEFAGLRGGAEADIIRFKKPSELNGTKELYPNPNDVMAMDVTNKGVPGYLSADYRRTVKSSEAHQDAMEQIKEKLRNASDEEYKHMTRYYYDKDKPKAELIDGEDGFPNWFADSAVGDLELEHASDETKRSLQYFGKSPYLWGDRFKRSYGDNLPDVIDNPEKAQLLLRRFPEILVKTDKVPSTLLTKGTGDVPTKGIKEEVPSVELPLAETESTTAKSMWPYIGLGAVGAGATGGLAYLAHKKNKEKKQEEAN